MQAGRNPMQQATYARSEIQPGYYLKFLGQFVRVVRGIGASWTVAAPLSQATRFESQKHAEIAADLLVENNTAARRMGGYVVEYVDGKLGCKACGARVGSLFTAEYICPSTGEIIHVAVCHDCAVEARFESEHALQKRMQVSEADRILAHGVGVSL